MAMKITTFLFAILAIWAFPNLNSAAHHHAAPVPAPAVDCSSVILNMADCLSFVTSGSTVAKPEGTCCSGLKTVLKTNAECLCEVLKHSGDLGISLNVTKAMTLPSICHLSAPSLSNCKMSTTTGPAPGTNTMFLWDGFSRMLRALSPMGMSPSSAAAAAPAAPTTGSGAPPPSLGSSASSTLVISVMSLVFSLLLVSLSLF